MFTYAICESCCQSSGFVARMIAKTTSAPRCYLKASSDQEVQPPVCWALDLEEPEYPEKTHVLYLWKIYLQISPSWFD